MSTGIVHHPDTPASSGSPSSQVETENSKMDDSSKNNDLSKLRDHCSSSPVNGDCHSSSSSSAPSPSITPNLSFTPQINGILTPPNDLDISNDAVKQDSAGRLKFYKDGVLCLELSHRDEGDKRKWVQIKTKQVFPMLIHTKKEVKIPRHASPTPPSFHSPLSSHLFQNRLESSASHTSDDGSSMLSSPRVRESSWRKPVPHKGISLRLEFYLKPAVCIQKFRESNRLGKLRLYRRPYYPCIISAKENSDLVCSCDISCENETLEKAKKVDSDAVDGSGGSTTGDHQAERLTNGTNQSLKKKTSKVRQSVLAIAEKLQCESERKLKFMKTKLSTKVQDFSIAHKRLDQTVCKKRVFRETDMKDFSSPVRPSKISPKSKSVKTILNIPGFNNDVKDPVEHVDSLHCPIPLHKSEIKEKTGKNGMIKKKSDGRGGGSSYPSPSSPVKIPRKSPVSPQDSHYANSTEMYLSSLPPKEQQIFQQQTMSKAISYTINSLLSNPHNQEVSRKHAIDEKEKGKTSKSIKGQSKHQQPGNSPHKHYFPVKNDLDQNSFLRHLLDTSDPIPNPNANVTLAKPEKVTNKLSHGSSSSSSSSSNTQSKNSSRREMVTETTKISSNVKSKSPHKPPPSAPNKNPPSMSQFSHPSQTMGVFPHAAAFLQHPALFGGGGFPLPLQAYESMFSGHQSSMGALEFHQYQSLLQQNLLALNPTLASAMAASYLGASSVHPPTNRATTSPSSNSIPPSTKSRRSDNTNHGGGDRKPLNLSQRDMPVVGPNGLTMSTSIPVPFQAPSSDTSHSRSGSANSRARLGKSQDNLSNDMPLNLSKKHN